MVGVSIASNMVDWKELEFLRFEINQSYGFGWS